MSSFDGRQDDPILEPGDVARMLGVNPRTVKRWADDGRLPSFRTPGGHRRFYLSDVKEAVDAASR